MTCVLPVMLGGHAQGGPRLASRPRHFRWGISASLSHFIFPLWKSVIIRLAFRFFCCGDERKLWLWKGQAGSDPRPSSGEQKCTVTGTRRLEWEQPIGAGSPLCFSLSCPHFCHTFAQMAACRGPSLTTLIGITTPTTGTCREFAGGGPPSTVLPSRVLCWTCLRTARTHFPRSWVHSRRPGARSPLDGKLLEGRPAHL